MNRKDVIINLLAIPMGVTAFAATAREASAAATMDQKSALYQSKPKNGQQCSTCSLYVPAKTNPTRVHSSG